MSHPMRGTRTSSNAYLIRRICEKYHSFALSVNRPTNGSLTMIQETFKVYNIDLDSSISLGVAIHQSGASNKVLRLVLGDLSGYKSKIRRLYEILHPEMK